jgi:hypothetical protein
MNDNTKQITKLQLAVAAAIDSYDQVTCADVADRAAEDLGYHPSPTHVSRVLKDWGWSKTTVEGRVGFVRPPAMQGGIR